MITLICNPFQVIVDIDESTLLGELAARTWRENRVIVLNGHPTRDHNDGSHTQTGNFNGNNTGNNTGNSRSNHRGNNMDEGGSIGVHGNILSAPVRNERGRVVAVLQAVDKLGKWFNRNN